MSRLNFDDTQSVQEIPPPIPAFSWLGSLSPLLLGPIGLLAMIALFAPDTVLDQWPLAKAFTNWMQLKLPFINRHADSTNYPQVALLVNCLSMALIPALGLLWMVASFANYPQLLARNRATKQLKVTTHLFIIFFGVPTFAAAIYFLIGLPGDPFWAKGFTAHRRGGMALMNGFMVWGSSAVFGGWPLMVRLFIDLHLRKGSSK